MSEQRMTTDDPAFLKHEAAFWEDRYKTQHRTVHALEDKLSLSLAREQEARAEAEKWKQCHDGQVATKRRLSKKYGELVAREQRLRDAIEEYMLWEPGRRGHAAAHERLREALSSVPDGEGQ